MSAFSDFFKRKKGINVLEGPVFGKIFVFCVPVILTNVLQWAYNAADSIVVGNFAEDGKTALAAVTANGALINMIIGVMVGLSVGASVLVAQGIGEQNQKKIEETMRTGFLVAIIGGLLVTAVGFSLAPILLSWMGTPIDILDQASLYLRIYFLGAPFNMVYLFGAGMLRANGNTEKPLLYLAVSGLANVIINVILVVVFHLGVIGVGVGTIASQIISSILVLIAFHKGCGPLKFSLKDLQFKGKTFVNLIKIGVPSGVQSICFALSNTIVTVGLNSFNNSAIIAGSGASTSIDNFEYMVLSGFAVAATAMVGQCYGAKRPDRIKKVIGANTLLLAITGIILSTVMIIFGRTLIGLYNQDPEVIEMGYLKMLFVAGPYVLCGILDLYCAALKSIDSAFVSMMISIVGVCAFRVGWILTVFRAVHTLEMLYIIYPLSWVLTASVQVIVFIIRFKKLGKKWSLEEEVRAAKKRAEEKRLQEKEAKKAEAAK